MELISEARQKLNPASIDFVIYHFPCHDGFTAAWCAWRYLKQFGNIESIVFHGTKHGDSRPDVTGKNVLIIDFSYKREILLELNEKASNLIVLDHHISAQKELENLDFAFFDMTRSGAGLAWDYFWYTESRPRLINFVEDRAGHDWRYAVDFNKIKTLLKTPIIIDGRNIYDPIEMEELGFNYISIGR